MKGKPKDEGKYEIGEVSSPSLGAAVAYAGTAAITQKRTMYVREIGATGAVARAEYDPKDGAVTVSMLTQEGSR